MESRTLLNHQTVNRTSSKKLGIITSRVSIHYQPRRDVERCVGSLTQAVIGLAGKGWSVDLLTMKPSETIHDRGMIAPFIREPIEAIYDRFVYQVTGRSEASCATWNGRLPILIGCADLPIDKKQPIKNAGINPNVTEGIHFHGLLVIPPGTQLGDRGAQEHFAKNDAFYRRGGDVGQIDLRPVPISGIKKELRYCLKTICSRDLGIDEGLLMLPCSLS